jgi:hypothetical protein
MKRNEKRNDKKMKKEEEEEEEEERVYGRKEVHRESDESLELHSN